MDYSVLKTELTTDPLTRGYSGMSDSAAASDLNTVYRDQDRAFDALLDYLVTNRAHTNQGEDTNANNNTPSTILGRLIHVAEQNILEVSLPIDVFGAGGTKVVSNTRELHSAKAFWGMIQAGHLGEALFTETEQGNILNDLINCGIMNSANRDAIIALSQNQQSRANELGLGRVSEGDVNIARSL